MSKRVPDWAKYGAIAGFIAILVGIFVPIYEEPLRRLFGVERVTGGGPLPPSVSLPPRSPARFTLESDRAPSGVHDFVRSLLEDGKSINSVSFRPGGGWLVVWDGNQYRSQGLTPRLRSVLDSLAHVRSHISDVVFAPWAGMDSWAIIHGNGEVTSSGAPPGAALAFDEARRAGRPISTVAFLDMGAWFMVDRDHVESGGPVPEPLLQQVGSALRHRVPRTLRLLGPGGYLMQFDDHSWTALGLPDGAAEELDRLGNLGKRVHVAAFTPDGGWLIVAEAG